MMLIDPLLAEIISAAAISAVDPSSCSAFTSALC